MPRHLLSSRKPRRRSSKPQHQQRRMLSRHRRRYWPPTAYQTNKSCCRTQGLFAFLLGFSQRCVSTDVGTLVSIALTGMAPPGWMFKCGCLCIAGQARHTAGEEGSGSHQEELPCPQRHSQHTEIWQEPAARPAVAAKHRATRVVGWLHARSGSSHCNSLILRILMQLSCSNVNTTGHNNHPWAESLLLLLLLLGTNN